MDTKVEKPETGLELDSFAKQEQMQMREQGFFFWAMLASFGILFFFVTAFADIFPIAGKLPGLYVRQFFNKLTLFFYTLPTIVICTCFIRYYLKRWSLNGWLSSGLALGLVAAIILDFVIATRSLGWSETYHNKVYLNGATYHLETANQTAFNTQHSNEVAIRVYKCEPAGVICSLHFTSQKVVNGHGAWFALVYQSDFTLSKTPAGNLQINNPSDSPITVSR